MMTAIKNEEHYYADADSKCLTTWINENSQDDFFESNQALSELSTDDAMMTPFTADVDFREQRKARLSRRQKDSEPLLKPSLNTRFTQIVQQRMEQLEQEIARHPILYCLGLIILVTTPLIYFDTSIGKKIANFSTIQDLIIVSMLCLGFSNIFVPSRIDRF